MSCTTCTPATALPRMQSYRRDESFGLGLDWSCDLGDGETISTATTTIERQPAAADELDDIVGTTSIDNTNKRTVIPIVIAASQPFGEYHIRHVMTSSSGNKWVMDHTLLIES